MVIKRLLGYLSRDDATPKEETEHERPTALQCAVDKGYLTADQANEIEDEINTSDLDPEETHTDLMVDKGLLTESQAEVIAIDVARENPQQALADRFKKAKRAMKDRSASAEEVGTKTSSLNVADVLAAKKGNG